MISAIRKELAEALNDVEQLPAETDYPGETLNLDPGDDLTFALAALVAGCKASKLLDDAEAGIRDGDAESAAAAAFRAGVAFARTVYRYQSRTYRHGLRITARQYGHAHQGITPEHRERWGRALAEAEDAFPEGQSWRTAEGSAKRRAVLGEARRDTGCRGLTWETLCNWRDAYRDNRRKA